MCGIVGYIGNTLAAAPIIDALKRLEYRGYDSAGIATLQDGHLLRRRAVGKLHRLADKLMSQPISGTVGIGHTRWATHGRPDEMNAHPHIAGRVAVVHNGIIENYSELRDRLKAAGARFNSETDTEVIAQLVSFQLSQDLKPIEAIKSTLPRLTGSFALAFLFEGYEDLIICARRGSPLAVGYGNGEMFIGSDIHAFAPFTSKVSYLNDGDIGIVTRDKVEFIDVSGRRHVRSPEAFDANLNNVDKGVYRHFMAKEINDQPEAVRKTLSQYIDIEGGIVKIPESIRSCFRNSDRVTITACGTAYYAGLIAKYWFERYAQVVADVDIASEFRYRELPLRKGNLAMFVSQSGETADTLASLNYLKAKEQVTVSITNVASSTMARISDVVLPTLAGPEIGVASTKAFTCQLATLACLAIAAGRERGSISVNEEAELVQCLAKAPEYVSKALKRAPEVRDVAKAIARHRNVLFLGRGVNYPLALEGALKLKEITYIHAEGYAAGELKHGPIALVDKDVPVVVIAPSDHLFEKTVSNMHEVSARGGQVILVTDHRGATYAGKEAWATLTLEDMPSMFGPIANAIPLQQLAYYTATFLGTDVDQPRNLAKSVTVE